MWDAPTVIPCDCVLVVDTLAIRKAAARYRENFTCSIGSPKKSTTCRAAPNIPANRAAIVYAFGKSSLADIQHGDGSVGRPYKTMRPPQVSILIIVSGNCTIFINRIGHSEK